MSTDTAPSRGDAEPEAPRRARWGRRRWLAVVSVLGLVVSLSAVAWVWRHPTSPFEGGYGLEVEREVGEPVWTSLVPPGGYGDEPVTLRDLTPTTSVIDIAGAFGRPGPRVEVEYLVCELDQGVLDRRRVDQFGFGGGTRDVRRYCATTRPAEGATLTPGSEPQQEVIVGITLNVPGRVIVRGHEVSYRTGWQVGSDVIDVETRVVAPPVR